MADNTMAKIKRTNYDLQNTTQKTTDLETRILLKTSGWRHVRICYYFVDTDNIPVTEKIDIPKEFEWPWLPFWYLQTFLATI